MSAPLSAVIPQSPLAAAGDADLQKALAVVRELTLELHPETPGIAEFGADASLERDFGLDSLARVELASRLEQAFATVLADRDIECSDTVRDLAQALERSPRAAPTPTAQPPILIDRATTAAPAAATLIEALEHQAARQTNRTHILFLDGDAHPQPMTFGALRAAAIATAAGLIRRGVRPGEAVAIMLPTGQEFFAAFYGTLYARAVPVPLYPPARPSQLESHLRRLAGILANCEARTLLTFDAAQRVAHLLRSLGTRLESIATIEEIAERGAALGAPDVKPHDTAFLQYTSGSTGQPKGVVLSHANLLANLEAMRRATGVTCADCFVSWLPLYHDMGLIGACLGALSVGFPLVLLSPFSFLAHPVCWLRVIERYRATITAAPNFAYELCVNKISEHELSGLDLGSLRLMFNGAEAVSPHTLDRFAERFAPYGLRHTVLMPVYGLAECALGLTFPPPERGPRIDAIDRSVFLRKGLAQPCDESSMPLRMVSCGKPLPGHSIRIVDTGGSPLPERRQGRIEFQGPSATSGYFRNPTETTRLFDGPWLDTGDLGYLADGELYVTGRAKDIIIRGGHNIHPQELEEAVGQLAGVRRGGVVVFPAAERASGTERIVVLAETRESQAPRRAEIVARIRHLAIDLIGLPVDEILLVPPRTVFKTSSGKIRRAACREAYEQGALGASGRAPWIQFVRLAGQAFAMRWTRRFHRGSELLWGGWVLLVAACVAPVLWLSVVLLPGVARRRRCAASLVRLALRLSGVSVVVNEPKQPTLHQMARSPHIFVSNHASYLDALLLTAILPPEVTFIAKREFESSLLLGPLLKQLGCVFVERHDVHEAVTASRELRARLNAPESLLVFAEGTFHRDPGLLPFHMGAFSTAAATETGVVAVAIRGTRAMLPDGALLPRRTPLEISFSEPIKSADSSWHAAIDLRRAARAYILEHVHEPDLEQSPASKR